LVRTSLVETPVAGVLATIAFLVVFRVLIKDFFWMVTGRSLNLFSIGFHQRFSLLHEPCQTRRVDLGNC
jgi:hypothetical protein